VARRADAAQAFGNKGKGIPISAIPLKAREAMDLARRGDTAGAILRGEEAVADAPRDAGLRMFLGMLHGRQGDLPGALPHLHAAAALMPTDPLPRLELARALAALGQAEEAEAILQGVNPVGPAAASLVRIRATIRQRQGRHREAALLLRTATEHDPRDFESFASLGISLLALGAAESAITALERSLALRPGQPAVQMRLVEAQMAAGRGAQGLAAARARAAAHPRDPLAHVTIARLEDLLGHPDRAETALDAALACDPACIPALLALADLAERDNRVAQLSDLVGRLADAGAGEGETALLRARLACRRGDHGAALAIAQAAPPAFDPGGRARIIGECNDRLGRPQAAFAACAEMNRITAAEVTDAAQAAAAYRDGIVRRTAKVTPEWRSAWAPVTVEDGRDDPVFLFGFPRSGTTLLDTLLMGHPAVTVLEERPALEAACAGLGDIDMLSALDAGAIAAARARYFAAVDALAPDAAGRLLVDKLPLGMLNAAAAHRLFPRARFIFAERHPCDVVLSCFMTRFDPRGGMANMLDLEDAARLYDIALTHWERCRAMLSLDVRTVRYERMIADVARELAPLADFLGLDIDAAMLDHQRTARGRAHIATPSYAQVVEPLYTRALARWEKYRPHMAAVLPLLAPWAKRMGYSCDEHREITTNVPVSVLEC